MKKFKYTILIILMAFLTGCSEDILNVENQNAITQYSYYKTADHAHQALVACYDAIKGNGLYGLRLVWVSNNLDDHTVYEKPTFEEFIYTADDDNMKYIWGYLYRGVAKCNLALEKIPQIEDPALTYELKERYLGEIRFLRSLYNFILHTRFNEPPLITEVITDMQATFGNSSWPEFLDQIEKDLLGYEDGSGNDIPGAIDILPVFYDDENIGRATKGAALTLMAKTYLYHEDWASAKKCLQDVISLNAYELSKAQGVDSLDYIYAYLANSSSVDLTHNGRTYKAENNSESIFSIQFKAGEFVRNNYLPGWMIDGSVYNAYNGINGWKNVSCSKSYAEEFESTPDHVSGIRFDPRKYGTLFVPGDTVSRDPSSRYFGPFDPKEDLLSHINTGYGVKKYLYPLHEGLAAPFNSPNDWRLFRYSEVLLMLAEAEFHLNGSTDLALNALNEVRERAGLELLTEITSMDIVHERSCEFGFEGERYWDLVRWGRIGGEWPDPADYMEGYVTGKHEFFPIPTYELAKMQGKLDQNPGW
jgi:hypothetical protein